MNQTEVADITRGGTGLKTVPTDEAIIGHQRLQLFLKNALTQHKEGHAYLFLGPRLVGKGMVARWLAGQIVGKAGLSRNLIWVASEGKIKITEVRRVQEELSLTNPFGKRRVVVLRRAETMTREAQNAFLKVLEEPRTDVVFILTAEDLAGLLPTVISRTQVVRFAPVSRDVIGRYLQTLGHAPETADRAARLSLGSPGRALELCVPGALVAREEENRQMLQLFGRLPHQRFRMVNQVLERDDPGALLSNLEGLLRDLWMFHTARRQYLVNRALQEELLTASYLFTREKICHCLIELHQLKNLWARQVNKKLSLERFFLTVLPIPE